VEWSHDFGVRTRGFIFGENTYIEHASRAAQFILTKLLKEDVLYRSYKDGKVRQAAFLDDYAFFIAALLDLYETTGDLSWFSQALKLDQTLKHDFEDAEHGGFFMTGHHYEKLIAREKPDYDGAEPSGNSVAIMSLLRLYEFTTKTSYLERAKRSLRAFSHTLASRPMALSHMLLALDFYLANRKQIALITPSKERPAAEPFLMELRKKFLPHMVFAIASEGEEIEAASKLIPWLSQKKAASGKPTAYVCEQGACLLPTTQVEVFCSSCNDLVIPAGFTLACAKRGEGDFDLSKSGEGIFPTIGLSSSNLCLFSSNSPHRTFRVYGVILSSIADRARFEFPCQ